MTLFPSLERPGAVWGTFPWKFPGSQILVAHFWLCAPPNSVFDCLSSGGLVPRASGGPLAEHGKWPFSCYHTLLPRTSNPIISRLYLGYICPHLDLMFLLLMGYAWMVWQVNASVLPGPHRQCCSVSSVLAIPQPQSVPV